MAGIQQSMTKRKSGQGRPKMSCTTKFALNLLSGLSANVQKQLNQTEAKKRPEFSKVWPKVSQASGRPVISPPTKSELQLDQQFVCIYVEIAWPIGGQETPGIQQNMTNS